MTTTAAPSCFKVRFYSPEASRKGKGVRVQFFATQAEADTFAAGKTLYARPAKAEPVAALSPEQARAAALHGGLL